MEPNCHKAIIQAHRLRRSAAHEELFPAFQDVGRVVAHSPARHRSLEVPVVVSGAMAQGYHADFSAQGLRSRTSREIPVYICFTRANR
jgi:hypothetical protein